MKKYFYISKPLFVISIILLIVTNMLWAGLAILIKYNTDVIFSGNIDGFKRSIIIAVIYLSGFLIISYFSEYTIVKVKQKFFTRLKNDIASHIENAQYQDFYGKDISEYISNLTNDINIVESNYFDAYYKLIQSVFLFIFTIYVLFYIHYIVLIVIGITGSLMFLIPVINNRLITRSLDDKSRQLKDFNSILRNTFAGFEIVNSFNVKKKFFDNIKRENEKLEQSKFVFLRNIKLSENIVLGLAIICQFSGIFTSGYLVLTNVITAGSIIAVIQLGNQVYNSLSAAINSYTLMSSSKNVNKKLCEFTSNQSHDGFSSQSFDNLKINNICFSYDDKNRVLDNVSYEFDKGKKYLIVGENGSGKSTLIKVIAGYFDSYLGDITINDSSVNSINELKVNSSVIHQNIYLFNISILENITLYRDYNMEEIINLCKELNIHDFIMSLDDGYNTVIDENSNMLSGGQKQKIIIIRALISDSNLLLLDEHTSALDKESTKKVNKVIFSKTNKTIISISHDFHPDTLMHYDYILRMRDGKLILNEEKLF